MLPKNIKEHPQESKITMAYNAQRKYIAELIRKVNKLFEKVKDYELNHLPSVADSNSIE